MKRSIPYIGAFLLAASILTLVNGTAMAGRIGGPMSAVAAIPAGMSVYYDISFAADERAVVTINGTGNSIVHLLVYDSDGHVFIGTGGLDRKTVTIDVYRAGVFRVEVRNLGLKDNSVTLTTN
jgi:hypothetical protein